MRILNWFRALHIRERYLAKTAEVLNDHEERVHRLEIALRRAHEKIDDLASSVESTRQRQNAVKAGRPRKDVNQVSLLEEIPHGDKAALRAFFRMNPPRADN